MVSYFEVARSNILLFHQSSYMFYPSHQFNHPNSIRWIQVMNLLVIPYKETTSEQFTTKKNTMEQNYNNKGKVTAENHIISPQCEMFPIHKITSHTENSTFCTSVSNNSNQEMQIHCYLNYSLRWAQSIIFISGNVTWSDSHNILLLL